MLSGSYVGEMFFTHFAIIFKVMNICVYKNILLLLFLSRIRAIDVQLFTGLLPHAAGADPGICIRWAISLPSFPLPFPLEVGPP